MFSDRVKGYFFAALGTIAFANVYIFSKAALNEVHMAQFGMYWFFIAFGLNLGWFLKTGNYKILTRLSKKQVRTLITLAFLEVCTTTSFFLSIKIIPDPAVTSFIGNLFPIFLTVMGILILKERFNWIETLGGTLALAGAFVISYQGGTTLTEFFIPGTGVVVINALFAATSSIIVKKNVRKMSPELLNVNRTFWLLIFSIGMLFIYKQSMFIPFSAIKNIAIGAFMGPFLGILSLYYSFHYIEVSKSSIVQSLKGVFVFIGSYIYFQTLPLGHQIIGGAITVLGVLVMSMGKAGLIKIRKQQDVQ